VVRRGRFVALVLVVVVATAGCAFVSRASVDSAGVQGNGNSTELFTSNPAISGDGRYVAFTSDATNLVAGDTNLARDVFVRDLRTGITTRVSQGKGTLQANGPSYSAAISGDGRYVAFTSDATNVVDFDTNLATDVFVRDRQTGITTKDSLGGFRSSTAIEVAISGDGRYVAFTMEGDVSVHDRQTGTYDVVSVDSGGVQANAGSELQAISSDGRYVVFFSYATNLVAGDTNNSADVFVRDRQTGITTLASVSNGGVWSDNDSSESAISSDGRYVAFSSSAGNLVAGDTNNRQDVFGG